MNKSAERIRNFMNVYYHEHRISPSISQMLGTVETDRDKLSRGIKRLVSDGYIRVSMVKNRKFLYY
jgi:hypothetical protein